MFPYIPSQPRNFAVKLESGAAHHTQPWDGFPTGFAPGPQPQNYPFQQNAPVAMYETVTTPRSWRATASPMMPFANTAASPAQVPKPASVKHLTCYFWAKHGSCKFSEENCLYAHHDTGKVAQGPLQVELGRPAVAGKNAISVKPIYQNWRGSGDSPSFEPRNTRSGVAAPDIQEQLRHIARKAKANPGNNSTSTSTMALDPGIVNVLPHKRRQSEATSPIFDLFQDGPPRHHGLSPRSTSDALLETQLQTLTRTTESLSSVVERSMKAFDAAAGAIHVDVESLVNVYRTITSAPTVAAATTAANSDKSDDDDEDTPDNTSNAGVDIPPDHLRKMSNTIRQITRVALDLSNMACLLSNTKTAIIKDLDGAGLRDLAPAWRLQSPQEQSQHIEN